MKDYKIVFENHKLRVYASENSLLGQNLITFDTNETNKVYIDYEYISSVPLRYNGILYMPIVSNCDYHLIEDDFMGHIFVAPGTYSYDYTSINIETLKKEL